MSKAFRQKPLNSQIIPKMTENSDSKTSVRYNENKYKLGGKPIMNSTSTKEIERHYDVVMKQHEHDIKKKDKREIDSNCNTEYYHHKTNQ